MDESLSPETLLALRVAAVAALYLFLVVLLFTLWAELRRAGRATEPEPVLASAEWLEVVDCEDAPGLVGQRYPLDPVSNIGRDRANTVILADPRISSRHARLVWRDNDWWLEDLGGRNGTLLNGRAVTRPTRVSTSDVVQLGPAILRMHSEPVA